MANRVLVVLDSPEDVGANAELSTAGRSLAADLDGAEVTTLVMLSPDHPATDKSGLQGEHLLVATSPSFVERSADAVVVAVQEAAKQLQPRVIIMAHNSIGREVAPRLAVRLRSSLVTDCTGLRIEPADGSLRGVRPCFSGKALSEWGLDVGSPMIATIRRQSIIPDNPEPQPSTRTVTELSLPGSGPARTRILERILPPPGQVRLEDAEVVVSVGRGVGSRADFEKFIVQGLAKELGAACGGSRGAVDLGIVPPELQVGLTGRVVSPKVYIAIGLSGAPQHMAGCSGARNIVAINTDPQAPIFGYAHFGVLGDYRAVVPALTARLREIVAVEV